MPDTSSFEPLTKPRFDFAKFWGALDGFWSYPVNRYIVVIEVVFGIYQRAPPIHAQPILKGGNANLAN